MPAVVEQKGMRFSIRHLNIQINSQIILEINHRSSATIPFVAQPSCQELHLVSAERSPAAWIWPEHLTENHPLPQRCEEITMSQKLPHPWDFDWTASHIFCCKSYWNLSDLNFQLLALVFLSPCDWRAFRTLYFLPGKVLTRCNQLYLNLLFDELNRSRFLSLSLQGCFSSSSAVIFAVLSCTVSTYSTFNISFTCPHLPPKQFCS